MQPGAPEMTPRKDETPAEFRARLRAQYAAADPEYRERLLARQRERRRQRYATDPVYREQFLERQRKRYATDLEYRQKIVTLRPQAGTPAQN
jgi:flagellum-specific peptidoglycan hydrolase FlgJ